MLLFCSSFLSKSCLTFILLFFWPLLNRHWIDIFHWIAAHNPKASFLNIIGQHRVHYFMYNGIFPPYLYLHWILSNILLPSHYSQKFLLYFFIVCLHPYYQNNLISSINHFTYRSLSPLSSPSLVISAAQVWAWTSTDFCDLSQLL